MNQFQGQQCLLHSGEHWGLRGETENVDTEPPTPASSSTEPRYKRGSSIGASGHNFVILKWAEVLLFQKA